MVYFEWSICECIYYKVVCAKRSLTMKAPIDGVNFLLICIESPQFISCAFLLFSGVRDTSFSIARHGRFLKFFEPHTVLYIDVQILYYKYG